jgi:hypothetical protein
MLKKLAFIGILFVFSNIVIAAQSADVGISKTYAGGEVKAVENGKIVLQTKDGAIDVLLAAATEYKRVSAENPSLKTAVAAALSDIGAGDKLLVTGTVSGDKKQIPAKVVYLMSKADIAQKLSKEAEEWQKRGIVGRATKVDFQTNQVTISVRGMTGETEVVVSPKDSAKFLRYAPDSIRYSEAKSSNIREIFVGDIVRALGDRSQDGASFQAEQILSGAFQTVGGTIKSVDAAKNEIVIENIQTKKDVTIVVGNVSTLKKFPAEMAQRMAQMQMMRANGIQPPGGQQQSAPNGGRPGGGGMRGGDINDMFERLPAVSVAELKPGEMIAVSSTKNDNPQRITAIRLLAGVEPFLRMPQAAGGRGRGGQGGQDSSFSIPGLDGADFP